MQESISDLTTEEAESKLSRGLEYTFSPKADTWIVGLGEGLVFKRDGVPAWGYGRSGGRWLMVTAPSSIWSSGRAVCFMLSIFYHHKNM